MLKVCFQSMSTEIGEMVWWFEKHLLLLQITYFWFAALTSEHWTAPVGLWLQFQVLWLSWQLPTCVVHKDKQAHIRIYIKKNKHKWVWRPFFHYYLSDTNFHSMQSLWKVRFLWRYRLNCSRRLKVSFI